MANEHLYDNSFPRDFLGDRGSVFAEYVVLLTVVALGTVAATVALGVPLTIWYQTLRFFMLLGVP